MQTKKFFFNLDGHDRVGFASPAIAGWRIRRLVDQLKRAPDGSYVEADNVVLRKVDGRIKKVERH